MQLVPTTSPLVFFFVITLAEWFQGSPIGNVSFGWDVESLNITEKNQMSVHLHFFKIYSWFLSFSGFCSEEWKIFLDRYKMTRHLMLWTNWVLLQENWYECLKYLRINIICNINITDYIYLNQNYRYWRIIIKKKS